MTSTLSTPNATPNDSQNARSTAAQPPAAVWVTGPQDGASARRAEHAEPARRPRSAPWPYAGLIAGAAGVAGGMLLSQGPDTYEEGFVANTDNLYDALTSSAVTKAGGGVAFVGLVAAVVFLVGLIRHISRLAPQRASLLSGLRMSAGAFLGASAIGVAIRYIASGGAEGGIDEAFYSKEASTVLAVLSDQLAFAAMLPGLLVMAIVGWVAVKDRVLPRTVGAITLALTAVSTVMTLALGLPYSAGLVVPVFLLLVGAAGVLTKREA